VSGRVRTLWLNVSQSLGFIPGLITAGFAALGIVLVEVDRGVDLGGVTWVFQGDGSAARTVLSVIAGSLITVAGLTFSMTMVVLQLASSQFSPRVLRTFFGDRVTQVTIGTYGGTFVYSLLVLRAVGSYGDSGFVPRLSVTAASLLGIGAVVLLIVFLHHVSQMVQVSHVTAGIARATLERTDALFPEPFVAGGDDDAGRALARWRAAESSGCIRSDRPGFVQRVAVDELVGALEGDAERVAVLVCPGDFVGAEAPIAELWPASAAAHRAGPVRSAVSIEDERDLDQDVDFGLRQLADIALRAASPSVNDPTTAVTAIAYMRTVLVRLAQRADPPGLERFDAGVVVAIRRRRFVDHLDLLLQISRHAAADGWVTGALLETLAACGAAAAEQNAHPRVAAIRSLAETIAEQAGAEATNDHDRRRARERLAAVPTRSGGADPSAAGSGSRSSA
jgi:uncharacterized membrane protein